MNLTGLEPTPKVMVVGMDNDDKPIWAARGFIVSVQIRSESLEFTHFELEWVPDTRFPAVEPL